MVSLVLSGMQVVSGGSGIFPSDSEREIRVHDIKWVWQVILTILFTVFFSKLPHSLSYTSNKQGLDSVWLKVRQIRNYFFKPTFLQKNKRTNSTLLLVELFFTSLFGRM
jgi:hypothetical protein